jgi:acetyl-CoA carboxylase biotin carboxyl carrier protein
LSKSFSPAPKDAGEHRSLGVSNNPKKSGPFDVKTVESLVTLMTEHDLSEIYLRDGNQHVRLRRGAAGAVCVPAAIPVAPAHAAAAAPATPTGAPDAKPAAPAASKKNLIDIKSETIGTFYAQPKPGEPPFVKLGSPVKPDTPVGVIVVMKTNNEVVANCNGVIAEILVKDEQFVEYGQVLFRVDPS